MANSDLMSRGMANTEISTIEGKHTRRVTNRSDQWPGEPSPLKVMREERNEYDDADRHAEKIQDD